MFESLLTSITSLGRPRGKGLSVPVFDGAFKPNTLLEEADILVAQSGFEDLAVTRTGQLVAALDHTIVSIAPDGAMTQIAAFDHKVSALAVQVDGALAVGLGDRVVTGVGTSGERVTTLVDGTSLVAVTALCGQSNGRVLVCDGSNRNTCADWATDLMGKNRSGRLLQIDPETGDTTCLASGLAYAFGAYEDQHNGILLSESWAHAVKRIGPRGAKRALDDLPGYPCRLARADGGGFWLTLFCSRTQLVEFVLKENEFRQEMMKTISPEHWISPTFGSGRDFLEPLQGGGVKQMGVLKPWAPPRSYGLIVRIGPDLIPMYSLHSRVGGAHHGICAAAQIGETLYVLSKGAGRILKLSVSDTHKTLFGEDAI